MSSVGPEMMSGVRASSIRIEVHLVHDREVEGPLDHLVARVFHVVAEVVEPELVVGRVGNVRFVSLTTLLIGEVGDDHSNGHAEEAVDLPHPLGVAAGEIVVDGDDVHALALERVEIDRQRRHQRLALAGLHLGDLAAVERDAADQLHVIVALAQRSDRRLAHRGEGFGQKVVQLLAAREPLAKSLGLAPKLIVGQRMDIGLEGVDGVDISAEPPDIAIVGRSEDALCH